MKGGERAELTVPVGYETSVKTSFAAPKYLRVINIFEVAQSVNVSRDLSIS